MGPTRRSPGEHVLMRELWQGKVWTVHVVTVVEDSPDVVALYIPEDVMWRGARSLDGETLRVPWEPWQISEPIRWRNHTLRLNIPGEPFSLSLTWKTDWSLINWYVNVEEPLRPSPLGYDYMDWTLDIVVAPDLSWHEWKDEEELEQAVMRGVYTREHSQEIRHIAGRALKQLLDRGAPFDRPWEDWRPDLGWRIPELPERWE